MFSVYYSHGFVKKQTNPFLDETIIPLRILFLSVTSVKLQKLNNSYSTQLL